MSQLVAEAIVNESHIEQFHREGYFLLPSVVPPEHLQLMRDECQFFIDRADHEMDAAKTDVIGLNHRGKRYFVYDCVQQRQTLRRFVFSPLMAQICQATLGNNAYLFWNQYVVKCADKGMKFSWHQDSGYVHPNHAPYLTCWITLDDVSEANGTVYLLPYSRSGIRTWVKHVPDPVSNDMVGYFGSDRGIPVIAPAGSIACFSSLLFHSSGANTTAAMRRIFLAQYSSEVIMTEDGTKPWGASEQFLRQGAIVASPAAS